MYPEEPRSHDSATAAPIKTREDIRLRREYKARLDTGQRRGGVPFTPGGYLKEGGGEEGFIAASVRSVLGRVPVVPAALLVIGSGDVSG